MTAFLHQTGLYLNAKQIDSLRQKHNIPEGEEWAPLSGFDSATQARVQQTLAASSLYSLATKHGLAMRATAEKGNEGGIVKRDYSAFAEVHDIPGAYGIQYAQTFLWCLSDSIS